MPAARDSARLSVVRRTPRHLISTLSVLCLATPLALASNRDLIGYTTLAGRPGALLANGAGIPVAQVEVFAPNTADYGPDPSSPVMAGEMGSILPCAEGGNMPAGQNPRVFLP